MRIVAQIIKEFSAEYPIYAGNPSQTSQIQQQQPKPHLFPGSGFPNPTMVNQQGNYGQQFTNPQPQNVNTNIAYQNVQQYQNIGNKNPKDQILSTLKTRCEDL